MPNDTGVTWEQMFGYEYDDPEQWLQGYVKVSEVLARALDLVGAGGQTQLVEVLDRLARELGLPVDRLGHDGYAVIYALLGPLQAAMEEGPDLLDKAARHREVALAAIKDRSLDSIVNAIHQFNWHQQRLDLSRPRVGDATDAIQQLLVQKISQRIIEAFRKWRKGNVWNADFQARLRARERLGIS